jgi:hypothetical protein
MRAGAELNRSSVQALSPSRGALTVNNSVIIARQHCVYRSSTDRRRMFYTLTGALKATRLNKTTILSSIESGKITGTNGTHS